MDGDTYSASSPSGQHPRGALGVLSSDVAYLAWPGARKERAHRGLSLDAHTTGQDTTAYNRTTKLPVSSRHNHMGLGRHSTIACAAIRQPANRRATLRPPAQQIQQLYRRTEQQGRKSSLSQVKARSAIAISKGTNSLDDIDTGGSVWTRRCYFTCDTCTGVVKCSTDPKEMAAASHAGCYWNMQLR